MADRKLTVKLIGDSSQLERVFGKTGNAASRMGSRVGGVFKGMARGGAVLAGVFGGAVIGGKALADVAGDLSEAQAKANVIFGESDELITAFGKNAAEQFGLSQRAATDFASSFGTLLKPTVGDPAELAAMSTALTGLSGDLASFHNLASEDVAAKIFSGLSGESEPLKALGVFLTAASVEAKAFELGLEDVNGEISESAKVQARYALILEQTTDAHGDFDRTSDGLANSQRTLAAQWENMKAKLGQGLAPIFAKFMQMVSDKMPAVIDWIGPRLTAAFEFASAWVRANWPQISATVQNVMSEVRTVIEFIVGWIRDNWPQISETAQAVFDRVSAIISAFVEMAKAFWAQFGDEILIIAKTAWELISGVVETATVVITEVFNAFSALFKGDWGGLWGSLWTIAVNLWGLIKFSLGVAWDGIKALAADKWEKIKGKIKEKWEELKTWFSEKANSLYDAGGDIIQGLWDGAKDIFDDFADWLAGKVNWAIGMINIVNPFSDIPDVGSSNSGALNFIRESGFTVPGETGYNGSTRATKRVDAGDTIIYAVTPEAATAAVAEGQRNNGVSAISPYGTPG